jgi:hypothetical protein
MESGERRLWIYRALRSTHPWILPELPNEFYSPGKMYLIFDAHVLFGVVLDVVTLQFDKLLEPEST